MNLALKLSSLVSGDEYEEVKDPPSDNSPSKVLINENYFDEQRDSYTKKRVSKRERKSFIISGSKKQRSILDEFFIVGVDPTKITLNDLENGHHLDPQTLFMLVKGIGEEDDQRR